MPVRGAVVVLGLLAVAVVAGLVSRALGISVNWIGWLCVGIPAAVVLGAVALVVWGKASEHRDARRTNEAAATALGGRVVRLDKATASRLFSSTERRVVAVSVAGLPGVWLRGGTEWLVAVDKAPTRVWIRLDPEPAGGPFRAAELAKEDPRFGSGPIAELLNTRRVRRALIQTDCVHVEFRPGVPLPAQASTLPEVVTALTRVVAEHPA